MTTNSELPRLSLRLEVGASCFNYYRPADTLRYRQVLHSVHRRWVRPVPGLPYIIYAIYVISVVYTSIRSNEVPFLIDVIMSGSHATNSEIPVTIRNAFISFVKHKCKLFLAEYSLYAILQVTYRR